MRSRLTNRADNAPEPVSIRYAREHAGLTQTEAAALVHTSCRAWQQWESGDRTMHPGLWELFRIKARKP